MSAFDRACVIQELVKLPFGWEVIVVEDVSRFTYVQVADMSATDNVTGQRTHWKSRKWVLSEHMTDGEIVQTIFLATMTAMEHEIRETFKYKDQAIFDPHYDVEKLVELRSRPDALKERD